MSDYGYAFDVDAARFDLLHDDIDPEFAFEYMDESDDLGFSDDDNYQYQHDGSEQSLRAPTSPSPWLSDGPSDLDGLEEDEDDDSIRGGYDAALSDLVTESDEGNDLARAYIADNRIEYFHDGHHRGDRSQGSVGRSSLASTTYLRSTPRLDSDSDSDAGSASSGRDSAAPSSSPSASLNSEFESGAGSSGPSFDSDPAPSAASPQSPGSASSPDSGTASSQEPADPHPRRRHHHRQSPLHLDFNNARASPRRFSLTPTIHPNRRLPQPHYHQNLSHTSPNHRTAPPRTHHHRPSDSSSSDNEPDLPHFPPPIRQARRSLSDGPRSDFSGERQSNLEHNPVPQNAHEPFPPFPEQLSPELEAFFDGLDSDDPEVELERIRLLTREQEIWRLTAPDSAIAARRARRPSTPIDWDAVELIADMDGDDELVEVVLDRRVEAPQVQHQQGQQQRRHRLSRQPVHRRNNAEQREAAVDVIDLTQEPDSPILLHNRPMRLRRTIAHDNNHDDQGQQHNPQQQLRPQNPRRQMSQNGRTPSLARSDGSILGQPHPAVIDLTNSPDQAARSGNLDELEDLDIPANRRLPAPVPAPQQNRPRNDEYRGISRDILRPLQSFRDLFPRFLAQIQHDAEVEIIGQRYAMNDNPLAGNQPEFNYQANGFGAFAGRQPTPKPDFEPPPPARPGFTRNTGIDPETGELMVIVCASCDNELKYDPEEEEAGPRPAKRPRNKKDREEHHFWAVKECGHVSRSCHEGHPSRSGTCLLTFFCVKVYCKNCYDNRKKIKSKEYEKFGFQVDTSHKTAKIICAVDDCDSDVTATNSWVGIFM